MKASKRTGGPAQLWGGMTVAVALGVMVAPPAFAAAPGRVLVLPLEGAAGVDAGLADQLVAILATEAPKVSRLRVTTLKEVQGALTVEQMRQLSGCNTPACATDVAAAMAAEQLVMGQIAKAGKGVTVTLSRMRSADGVVLGRAAKVAPNGKSLLRSAGDLARQLFTDVNSSPVTVKLRVKARRKGSSTEVVLKGGEKLEEGDRVAFEFNVSTACHVYLVQRTRTSGAVNVLFPSAAIDVTNPIAADTTVRIPAGADWYELDDQDLGLENVYIVASPLELGSLAASVAKLEAGAPTYLEKALAALAQKPGTSCAGGLNAVEAESGCARRTRGLKLKSAVGDTYTAQVGSSPGDDTVLTVFSFEHAPAANP